MKQLNRGKVLREVRGYAEALIIAFLFVTFVFNTMGVVGASMLPTLDGGPGSSKLVESLLVGDRVLVSKYHNWLVRAGILSPYVAGTVVVLRSPTSSYEYESRVETGCFESLLINRCRPFFIKRVVAGPGDVFSIDAGQLVLNGNAVNQDFITDTGIINVEPVNFPVVRLGPDGVEAIQVGLRPAGGDLLVPILPTAMQPTEFISVDHPLIQRYLGSVIDNLHVSESAREGDVVLASVAVPEKRYFVMGDNRSIGGSLDSRAFGLVSEVDIAGPATAVLWPPRRDGRFNWRLLTPPEQFNLARQPN